MKTPLISCRRAVLTAVLGLAALPVATFAQDLTPPTVANPLADLTVAAGTARSVVNLKKTFALSGVTGQVVRMATVEGNIDIELLNDETPLNVANFLSYVNSGEYNKTFIHRLEPGFVAQGGGYYITSTNSISHIATNAPVVGEHVRSNTRGTLALALSSGPDSGTSEWFFNLTDNNGSGTSGINLDDASDGGPFTVFARVIEDGLTTMDAIAALPVPHPPQFANTALADAPLINYSTSRGVQVDEFVYLNDVAVIPLVDATPGADSVFTLKVKNSNPGLVTAKISGRKLKLAYAAGQTGTATIKVFATDSAGSRIKTKFKVTVQ